MVFMWGMAKPRRAWRGFGGGWLAEDIGGAVAGKGVGAYPITALKRGDAAEHGGYSLYPWRGE